MENKGLSRRRPSFRKVLYTIFVIEVCLAVALTGWIFYSHGRDATAETAGLLRRELATRIQDTVVHYLNVPRIVNQINADAIELGFLDPDDQSAIAESFTKLGMVFDDLRWIAYGSDSNAYTAFERYDNGLLQLELMPGSGDQSRVVWNLDSRGKRATIAREEKHFTVKERPWYLAAAKSDGPTWAEPYVWLGGDAICIDALTPVRDEKGHLRGVLEAGFTLDHISAYLASLKIGKTGRAVIVDGRGKVIAAGADDVVKVAPGGKRERVDVGDLKDPLTRAATEHIRKRGKNYHGSAAAFESTFELEGDRIFLRALPLPEYLGLDWLIVVAIPESDFAEHVEASKRDTLIFALAALLLTIFIGILVVRWIGRPLAELAMQAEKIRDGDYNLTFEAQSRDEIGTLVETMGEMVKGLKERETIREAFGRYVTPEFVEDVLNHPGALKLGGDLRIVTVMMTDLRGFTALSTRLTPPEMIALLNEYFSCMSKVIATHHGTINEFIGDAILALFGALTPHPDDPFNAARCAVDMQLALREFNAQGAGRDLPGLEMGIGLHIGEVVVGNIGSEEHVKYGVVGDTVNTTARIESLTVGQQVLVSSELAALLGDRATIGNTLSVQVKGRSDLMTVYDLVGIDEFVLSVDEEEWRPVDAAIELTLVEGKQIAKESSKARLVGLRGNQLRVTGYPGAKVLANLLTRIQGPDETMSGDIYVKVTEAESADDPHITLTVTSLGPEDTKLLEKLPTREA